MRRATQACDSVEGRCGHGREDLRLQVISGTSWLKEAAGRLLAAACVETMAALKQVSHSRAFGGPFVAHSHFVFTQHLRLLLHFARSSILCRMLPTTFLKTGECCLRECQCGKLFFVLSTMRPKVQLLHHAAFTGCIGEVINTLSAFQLWGLTPPQD